MIPIFETTIDIERSVADVFLWVRDLENYPRWFPGIVDMASADDLPKGQPGKWYGQVDRLFGLIERPLAVQLVECAENWSIAFHVIAPPVFPCVEIRTRACSPTATRVTWRLGARSHDLITRRFGVRLLRPGAARRAPLALRRLKELLEAQS
jgi:hypothetical protein